MSTANGFSDQAVYNAEYLNLSEPVGYRGLNLERINPTGTFTIPLGGDGVGRKAQLGLGSLPASSTTAAYELNLYFPTHPVIHWQRILRPAAQQSLQQIKSMKTCRTSGYGQLLKTELNFIT